MCKKLVIPESHLPVLEAALGKEKDAKVVRWLLGLRLLIFKQTPHAIGIQLGVSEHSVRNWAHRFLSGGIESMRRGSSPGHPPKLPHEEEERFKQRIRSGPTEADGVPVWRGRSVMAMLQRDFDASYTLSGVYILLHRMGFSSLMPRAKHPDSSVEEQELFQKKRSPKHLKESAVNLRKRKSSCGFKTKPASANRAL